LLYCLDNKRKKLSKHAHPNHLIMESPKTEGRKEFMHKLAGFEGRTRKDGHVTRDTSRS